MYVHTLPLTLGPDPWTCRRFYRHTQHTGWLQLPQLSGGYYSAASTLASLHARRPRRRHRSARMAMRGGKPSTKKRIVDKVDRFTEYGHLLRTCATASSDSPADRYSVRRGAQQDECSIRAVPERCPLCSVTQVCSVLH